MTLFGLDTRDIVADAATLVGGAAAIYAIIVGRRDAKLRTRLDASAAIEVAKIQSDDNQRIALLKRIAALEDAKDEQDREHHKQLVEMEQRFQARCDQLEMQINAILKDKYALTEENLNLKAQVLDITRDRDLWKTRYETAEHEIAHLLGQKPYEPRTDPDI